MPEPYYAPISFVMLLITTVCVVLMALGILPA